jgi:hypothetical protein
MHDRSLPEDPAGDALAFQALCYAAGEMALAEAQAFERRLGDDQSARDALARAVRTASALAGDSAPAPDPAYRAAVRQRLQPGLLRSVMQRRSYRGHPVVWTGIGAAAAVLLMLGIGPYSHPDSSGPLPAAPEAATLPAAPGPPPAESQRPSAVDMANLWAELDTTEHLAKARQEEMRRKVRAEGHRPRTEEHRQRPMGNLGTVH